MLECVNVCTEESELGQESKIIIVPKYIFT